MSIFDDRWLSDGPEDWTECVGCGDIFLESELESGACPTCWDNRTKDEDD